MPEAVVSGLPFPGVSGTANAVPLNDIVNIMIAANDAMRLLIGLTPFPLCRKLHVHCGWTTTAELHFLLCTISRPVASLPDNIHDRYAEQKGRLGGTRWAEAGSCALEDLHPGGTRSHARTPPVRLKGPVVGGRPLRCGADLEKKSKRPATLTCHSECDRGRQANGLWGPIDTGR